MTWWQDLQDIEAARVAVDLSTVFPTAAIRSARGLGLVGAHSVSPDFLLRALAAWVMLRQLKIRCCRAAEKPAVGAECSNDQRSNSHNAENLTSEF